MMVKIILRANTKSLETGNDSMKSFSENISRSIYLKRERQIERETFYYLAFITERFLM